MLPFLKPQKMASTIMASVKPHGIEDKHEEGDEHAGLMSAAEELISAVHMKDAKAVASALKAAFEMMESEPHEEGEHI